MASTLSSASGEKLHPLGKGLYACVSVFDGQVLIHIRAFCTAENLQKQDNKKPAQDINIDSPLYPTKRGVALNIAAFDNLLACASELLDEIQTKSQSTPKSEDDNVTDTHEGYSQSRVDVVTAKLSKSPTVATANLLYKRMKREGEPMVSQSDKTVKKRLLLDTQTPSYSLSELY